MMDNILETLAHGCTICGQGFSVTHRVTSIYRMCDVGSFEFQAELGIIGGGVRNFWAHVYCHDPALKEQDLKPSLHHCVECRETLDSKDMIIPVFQVIDPRAVNPLDPTDVGISLGERVYFIHGNCRNKSLSKHSDNPLYRG